MNIKTIGSGSSGNCYYLTSDSSASLLLDAGIPFKKMQKAINFKTSSLSGVLVTHEHLDHAGYVKEYLDNSIEVFMTKGTQEALQLPSHYCLNIIDIKKPFMLDEFKIMAFDIIHDAKEPCGFLIESGQDRLLYATDTKLIKYEFQKLTHIMLEANYDYKILKDNVENEIVNKSLSRRIMDNHMSLDTAIDYLSKIDLTHMKEIIIIHLSNDNARKNYFKERLQKATGRIVKIAE